MKAPKTRTEARHVVEALNTISKGRMVMDWNEITAGANPYVVMKTSNIPGKSVLEIPGLIFGDKHKPVSRIGVGMTLTESVIELASAMKLDLIIVHHPVADAASSGGVPLRIICPCMDWRLLKCMRLFMDCIPD